MRIFIGSSHESLKIAHRIAAMFEIIPDMNVVVEVWDSVNLFTAGEHTFTSLENITKSVDAALFVFSEDDKVWYRNGENGSVRDNVLFEYGLFAGALSKEKVAIVKVGNPKPISDLKGLNYIPYDEMKRNIVLERLSAWLKKVNEFRATYTQNTIRTMGFLDALHFAITSSEHTNVLEIFAISTSFSSRIFRSHPSLNIGDAYILLRKYENDDPYYNGRTETSIADSVRSWKRMETDNNINHVHIGYFNYHPDEGFYLFDDRILITGHLHTCISDLSVNFDRTVIVVENTSEVGRNIISLYQQKFDRLKENYLHS